MNPLAVVALAALAGGMIGALAVLPRVPLVVALPVAAIGAFAMALRLAGRG